MDPETLKYLGSLGVGGTLAVMMFLIYRKDMKVNSEQWQGQSEVLMDVVKENTAAITALIQIVKMVK